MTLKERILNRKPSVTKEELERMNNSELMKRYDKFIDICEKLEETMDISEVYFETCQDVFDFIEKII